LRGGINSVALGSGCGGEGIHDWWFGVYILYYSQLCWCIKLAFAAGGKNPDRSYFITSDKEMPTKAKLSR
jgi:hypothetical protein